MIPVAELQQQRFRMTRQAIEDSSILLVRSDDICGSRLVQTQLLGNLVLLALSVDNILVYDIDPLVRRQMLVTLSNRRVSI